MKLTKFEKTLWLCSVLIISVSFFFGTDKNPLTLIASLIGVTSLIFIARGEVIGQILMIIFSLIYGYISFGFAYYGEMLTYVGMTAPTAAIAAVEWIRHPFEKGKSQVAVAKLTTAKITGLGILTVIVTGVFYLVLKYFNTANLIMSTISVATSFFAAGLSVLRSPYYALAYASNDVVLIVMWLMASITNRGYIPMAVCFIVFLVNDIYGFVSWKHMMKMQKKRIREMVEGK